MLEDYINDELYSYVSLQYLSSLGHAKDYSVDTVVNTLVSDVKHQYLDRKLDEILSGYNSSRKQTYAYDKIADEDEIDLLIIMYDINELNTRKLFSYGFVGMYVALYKHYIDKNLHTIAYNYVMSQKEEIQPFEKVDL